MMENIRYIQGYNSIMDLQQNDHAVKQLSTSWPILLLLSIYPIPFSLDHFGEQSLYGLFSFQNAFSHQHQSETKKNSKHKDSARYCQYSPVLTGEQSQQVTFTFIQKMPNILLKFKFPIFPQPISIHDYGIPKLIKVTVLSRKLLMSSKV